MTDRNGRGMHGVERIAFLPFMCLSVVLSGCVMYETDRTPDLIATGARAELALAPRIDVALHHRRTSGGEPEGDEATDATYRAMRLSFERVREGTPFLKNAREGMPKPDFILDLDTELAEYGKVSKTISDFTLMLIPGFFGSGFTVDATLKTPDGQTIGRHRASFEMKAIAHLLLVVALPKLMPFTYSADEESDDTYRDVLIPISHDLEEYLAKK